MAKYLNKTMSLDCVYLESALSHATSPSLSEFGPERSPLVVQLQSHSPTSTPPAILQELHQPDSTSYVLLNLAKGVIKFYLLLICIQFSQFGFLDPVLQNISKLLSTHVPVCQVVFA